MGHVSWAKKSRTQDTISFLSAHALPHMLHLFESREATGRIR